MHGHTIAMGRFNRNRYTHANTATVVVPGIGNMPAVIPHATLVANVAGDEPIQQRASDEVDCRFRLWLAWRGVPDLSAATNGPATLRWNQLSFGGVSIDMYLFCINKTYARPHSSPLVKCMSPSACSAKHSRQTATQTNNISICYKQMGVICWHESFTNHYNFCTISYLLHIADPYIL